MIYTNITEVCNIQIGKTPKRSESKYWGQGNSWVSIADMNSKFIGNSKEEINDLAVKEHNMKIVPKNTLIMSFKLSIGKVGITTKELYTNEAIAAFMIKDPNILHTEYLYYVLRNYNYDHLMDSAARGKTLNKRKLAQIEIPLISIKQQEQIINVLNKAENLLRFRQQQIETLSNLQHSVFNKLFVVHDDKSATVPLKDLCMINPRKSEIAEDLYEKEITFLPMTSVSENGEVNLSETRILSDVYSNYTYFAEGDVLFAKITPCMENGKGAIVKGLKNKIGFGSTEFHVLRPNKDITPEWIYFLTKSREFREIAEGNMTGSAGQKRVPRSFLENYQVTIPTKSKQDEFEVFYYETEKIKQKINRSLSEFETLFQNLIHKAFNGELFKEDIKV
ncbi:restriction endonuclease subunit S [Virgibacillus sp. W0430]|uniref:restriction endonuclease subunit S n=1 Tax=Virgibacillus sp. W0430 TaxID=3391580 RepID=UPI003F4781FF